MGSSASRIDGLIHQRAGNGDALALTARELVRLVVHAAFEIHLRRAAFAPLDALVGRHAGVDQRQFHIVQRGGARQQVERLENEADFLVADARQLVVGHRADQVAVDVVLALGRRIQAADQVHQRRLARAGRAHDGDILAALDLDVDTGDRVDLLVAHDVRLPQIVRADDDSLALELLAALLPLDATAAFAMSLRFRLYRRSLVIYLDLGIVPQRANHLVAAGDDLVAFIQAAQDLNVGRTR